MSGVATAGVATAMDSGLLTYADLEARWKAVGATERERHLWITRYCRRWQLNPLKGGRGENARFRMTDVLRAEARAAGERSPR